MKSEERHELQQNDLASWVYTVPILLKQYGSYILLFASCCVLAFMLWQRYERNREVAVQTAWTDLTEATGKSTDNPPAKLRAVIASCDNRLIQAEAYRRLGKFYHQTVLDGNPPAGVQGVKITRDDALDQAESALKKVTTEYADLPTAVASATLELGAVQESRHNWDAAKSCYEKLTAKNGPFVGSAFAVEAQHRLDDLGKYEKPIAFGPSAASQPTSAFAPGSMPSFLEGIDLNPPAPAQ